MRLPLATLEIFTAIARQGSLRAAAESLGLKPSTVSHQLKALEEQLGTALFIRTTRSVNLTDAGRALMRGAGPAFDQLSEAVESARTTGHAARGTLKLAMPEFAYDLLIGPALPSFGRNYPDIEIEMTLTDALSDLPGEELHAGFRLGDRIDDDMVAIRMTPPMPLVVAAGPEYLEAHGSPKSPADLLRHKCIRYRFKSSRRIAAWTFSGPDGTYDVGVTGKLVVDGLPASVDLAVRNLGFVYTFRDYCADHLTARRLVPVLEQYLPQTPGIYMYFPREYRSMLPLRLFLDHLKSSVSN